MRRSEESYRVSVRHRSRGFTLTASFPVCFAVAAIRILASRELPKIKTNTTYDQVIIHFDNEMDWYYAANSG